MYECWVKKMVRASRFHLISIPNNQCNSPRSVTSMYFLISSFTFATRARLLVMIVQSSTSTIIAQDSPSFLKTRLGQCQRLAEYRNPLGQSKDKTYSRTCGTVR